MARVTIIWDSAVGYYRMTTPYNATFVQTFKDVVPGGYRQWDDKQRNWLLDERAVEPVKQLCDRVWHDTHFVSRADVEARERSAIQPGKRDSLDAIIVQFVKLCPQDALTACYRKAALALHPDRQGGDESKMTRLNMLWSRLKDELYANAG